MSEPFEPNLRPAARDGIPAADPGPGAPPTAPGFGVEGEDPDAARRADGQDTAAARRADGQDTDAARRADGQDTDAAPGAENAEEGSSLERDPEE